MVRLHFRFAVEYLIEDGLLSPEGAVCLSLPPSPRMLWGLDLFVHHCYVARKTQRA
jgi:hypothetical protein